jgi:dihydropyrimidinase
MEADLTIKNGKISAIGQPGTFASARRVVNAKGMYVLPGAIDPHVHVHWPFLTSTTVDNYAIASRAAALGGTTTFIDFAHPKMGASPLERINNRRLEVGNDSVLDYSLHCVISNRETETLRQIQQLVHHGVTSFKMYMTYSRRKIMADDSVLYAVMSKAASLGALVCVHAENGPVGDAMEAQFFAEGRTKAADFPQHKPNFIEAEAVERSIFWAKQTGARLYFFHITTREGLEIIRDAKKKGLPIVAETCPQYLLLNQSVYSIPNNGHRFICSPPIRSIEDNLALWQGVQDGTISVIGTDHCAFTIEQKDIGIDNFINVPNGLPGIETRLSLIWSEGVMKNRITPVQFSKILSYNPSQIFGLFPQKGCIAIGSDADLVLFDPSYNWNLTCAKTNMGVDWSPYEGWKMQGKVMHTIVRGELVVEDGEFIGCTGRGSFLKRKINL